VDQTYTFVFSFFLSLAITLPSIETEQIWPYINNLAIAIAMTNEVGRKNLIIVIQ
jgi:hypothetical protein